MPIQMDTCPPIPTIGPKAENIANRLTCSSKKKRRDNDESQAYQYQNKQHEKVGKEL